MHKNILRATIANLIILGSGFFREIVFSYRFGVSEFSESFFIVYLFLEEFNVVITSGIVFGLIAFYKKIEAKKINLEKYIINILSVLTVIFLFSIPIFYLVFSSTFFNSTISSIFIFGANGILLYSMTGILTAYLIFRDKIFIAIISKAFNYVGLIVSFMILDSSKPVLLGLAISLSILIQLSFLCYHFLKVQKIRENYTSETSPPKILNFILPWGLAPFMMPFLGNLIIRLILMNNGSNELVSYNAYANKLMAIPNAITLSFLLVGFSNVVVNSNFSTSSIEIVDTIKKIILALLPLSIIIFFFSFDIIRITYQRGEFEPYMIQNTAIILSILSLGIVPGTIYGYLAKIQDALYNDNFFVKSSFLWMLINIFVTYILVDFFPFASFAFGSITALFIVMILSIVTINKKLDISRSFNYLAISILLLLTISIYSLKDLMI